jgi:hypothetical protein
MLELKKAADVQAGATTVTTIEMKHHAILMVSKSE